MMTTLVIKSIMPRIDIVTTMAVDMVIALAPDPTPHVSGYYSINHNYNKIVKSDWLSTALISALIGQFNRTVRVITRALKWLFFFTASKTKFRISCVLI